MLTSRFRELVLLEIAEPSLEIHTIHNFYAHGRGEPNRHLMLQGSLSPYHNVSQRVLEYGFRVARGRDGLFVSNRARCTRIWSFLSPTAKLACLCRAEHACSCIAPLFSEPALRKCPTQVRRVLKKFIHHIRPWSCSGGPSLDSTYAFQDLNPLNYYAIISESRIIHQTNSFLP